MTVNHLCSLLMALCAAATADFRMETPDGNAMKAPAIFDGYVPRKRSADGEDFPFVLIRPTGGSAGDEESSIDVKIIVGCASQDDNGYRYAINVAERIRIALVALPDRMLDRRFMLTMPVKWDLSDDQPWPSWLLSMDTQWTTRTPDLQISDVADVLGYFRKEAYE